MKFSRERATGLRQLLDDWLPPGLHDSKTLMGILFGFLFKDEAGLFMSFKKEVPRMEVNRFDGVYKKIESVAINRETDLSKASFDSVLKSIRRKVVLEVGCGSGKLSGAISNDHDLTASDIVINSRLR